MNGNSRASHNPSLSFGNYLLMGYVFLAFSRVIDNFLPGYRLALVFYVGMFLATLLAGSLFSFLKTGIGKWLFAFTL